MVGNRISQLSYYFPWSLAFALIIAVIFAIIGVLIFKKAMSQGEEEPVERKPSPYIEKIRTYFARLGYFGTDPLSQSFSYALKLMFEFIGGSNFRYKLPWIAVLGTSDSGKSSVLASLNLDRPIGRPFFTSEMGDKPICDWWFYDHGIALDLDGKVILDKSQASSDEDKWKLFVDLLQHHRPKRALDGIVLTIPASEFMGQNALSHDDLRIRAEYLYGKLWQMQYLTGIRVPIYVVITKCDLIPGFSSFCKSIPTRNKHDIFGWSNDHAVDAVYETTWIDEAFSSINNSLYQAQEEIYSNGTTIEGRDGVFLFPIALNQLKGGIRTYADHIFKDSGYHESFFLRGLYFVGDVSLDKVISAQAQSNKFSLNLATDKDVLKRNIYFADNVFENKIFREVGLARPISRMLLGSTTVMRFAKVGVAVAVVLGTLGLLRANETLQNAKMNLVPALTQIDITLEKTKGQTDESNIGRVFFEDQAEVLLSTMTQISVSQLTNLFIPPSWFSNLDAKIKYVMGIAYDRVILRSMSSELAYKANQTFSLDSIIPITQPITNGIDPLQTAEFYRLQSYVLNVRQLEEAANRFNQLGKTSSMRDVADIINYLFNYQLPEDFYEHTSYYVDALRHTNLKSFDFNSYRDDAATKLRKLFDEFQIAAFDPDQIIPGVGVLMASLNEFSGARNYASYDKNLLREIYQSLQITIDSLQNPGLDWLDADHFSPGPAYEHIIGLIVGSTFFPESVSTELINEVDTNFTKFREKLGTYSSPLISGANLFKVEDNKATGNPTEGALILQKSLALFFRESFMQESEDKTIITNVPVGSILLWDTLRLQEAIDLITDYNTFTNSKLLNMPKLIQPMLQKIARDSLTSNLVRLVVDAEVFSSTNISTLVTSPEDAILSQVQNYRAASPFLEQILFAFKANNANSAFSVLKGLLTKQAYTPLQTLDQILTAEAPYAIKMNSFDWWTGENLAALEAYGVTNLTELKNYLELQRDRINYLAQEFAAPLVSFLSQVNQEGMPGNLPLVTKWEGIINELNGYQKKAPGNALLELENYIMTTLNDVTLSTCKKYASSVSPLSIEQDYIVSILINLQEKLLNRCESLSGAVSTHDYSHVAQFFNSNLAGKFPFVEDDAVDAVDANPEDIRAFFDLIDSQGVNLKATLKDATDLGPQGMNAYAFIDQIEKIRAFFGGYLVPDSTLPYPSFTFDVSFRVNKDREVRANEILKWELKAEDTTVTMRSPTHVGYWKQGDPISMTFKWALNSPLQPEVGEGSPAFEVQGENATFSYSGTWALLRLLRCHKASPSDFDSLNDDVPNTLRFDIPLTSSTSNKTKSFVGELPKATVFVRLQVAPIQMKPAKKAGAANAEDASKSGNGSTSPPKIKMGIPVAFPYFPAVAPRINNSIGGN